MGKSWDAYWLFTGLKTKKVLQFPASLVAQAVAMILNNLGFIVAWGLQPVKDLLKSIAFFKFENPGLNGSILKPDGSPLVIKAFELNYLSASGSAVVLATLISIPLIGISFKDSIKIFTSTLHQLIFPIITIASIVGYAFVANYSGMSITMAFALASTGIFFPFFSPILGWLGVFLTGSDTSANALFSKIQSTTADSLGFDPVVAVSANASGGVTGKMISPQSIAVGAAAVGLVGKEADLFRFTFKHSFFMLLIICILTCLQVYVMKWIVPTYQKIVQVSTSNQAVSINNSQLGLWYLLILALAVSFTIIPLIFFKNKSK
jgi:lactate permease